MKCWTPGRCGGTGKLRDIVWARLITRPVRTRPQAYAVSASPISLSAPRSSASPQRPQASRATALPVPAGCRRIGDEVAAHELAGRGGGQAGTQDDAVRHLVFRGDGAAVAQQVLDFQLCVRPRHDEGDDKFPLLR